MYKKTKLFVVGTLITSLLTGCATVEEVSNMTVGEIVNEGVDAGAAVWDFSVDAGAAMWGLSKEMLQNLDKESIVYVSKLAWHSAPLALVYVELNLLYANPETYDPNEWNTLFQRNHQRIVDTKANIEGLTPTAELQGLHEAYIALLTHTIAVNEKALVLVQEGGEITAPLVEEFQSLQSQYEEINSVLEVYNN